MSATEVMLLMFWPTCIVAILAVNQCRFWRDEVKAVHKQNERLIEILENKHRVFTRTKE